LWQDTGGPFALSSSGDAVIVYCLMDEDETTIHPVGGLSISGPWNSSSANALPLNLIGFAPALPHADNYAYDGIVTGEKHTLQAALMDTQNWHGSNSEAKVYQGASFTIVSHSSR
jgi:hypothetical protein